MITRTQAEALLTLAESLEACERQGVHCTVEPNLPSFRLRTFPEGQSLNAMDLRLAVNALIPKSETWVVAHTMTLSCPAWDEDIVVIKPCQET